MANSKRDRRRPRRVMRLPTTDANRAAPTLPGAMAVPTPTASRATYREEPPRPGDASQLVLSAVHKHDARPGNQVGDRARHQHLGCRSQGGDARPDVDGQTPQVAIGQLNLARVHTSTDLDPERCDHISDRAGTADRPSRAVERREEAVARRGDLRPRKRASSVRTARLWSFKTVCHARSPSAAASSVDPTMSVNSTVARTRSGSRARRAPVRNSSTCPSTVSAASP